MTADELRAAVTDIAARLDPKDPGRTIQELLEFTRTNLASFDAEANKIVDKSVDVMFSHIEKYAASLPDGPEAAEFRRMLRRHSESYPNAALLVTVLASERALHTDLLDDAHRRFVPLLQSLLDLIVDVTLGSSSGAAAFASTALLCAMANELLVGFHLAQRGYSGQAYSHFRTILEFADKIDLFQTYPDEADAWVTAQGHKEEARFFPKNVRERLGRAKHDPIYTMLSKLGPHGTFEGIQLFSGKEVDDAGDDRRTRLRVWIGGLAREDQLLYTHLWLLYCVVVTTWKACALLPSGVPEQRIRDALDSAMAALVEAVRTHLIPWMRENGNDVSELEQWVAAQAGSPAS